jgi:hypothetical protein
VVPILLAVFLSVINPHYLLVIFSDPFGWLLAVCFALAVLLNALTMPNRLGVASDPPPRFLIGGWATASMGIFLGVVSMTTLLVGPAIVMVIRLTVVHMLAMQIGYGVIIALDITFAVGVAIAIARTRCVGSQG